jgi:hypothetical protein
LRHARAFGAASAFISALLAGCVTPPPPYDYSALKAVKPATLLVLPPLNDSPEVNAVPGVWSHATLPLAEGGYYVLPVALVNETFRQNGVTSPNDAHSIAPQKLREYFGADAAVYLKVKKYGTSYKVVLSETSVELEAKVVDLRTGAVLWAGEGRASSAEQQQQQQGGLIGLLVAAIVLQVVGTATDASYNYAGTATLRTLTVQRYNGLLPGPRSPMYGQVPVPAPGR